MPPRRRSIHDSVKFGFRAGDARSSFHRSEFKSSTSLVTRNAPLTSAAPWLITHAVASRQKITTPICSAAHHKDFRRFDHCVYFRSAENIIQVGDRMIHRKPISITDIVMFALITRQRNGISIPQHLRWMVHSAMTCCMPLSQRQYVSRSPAGNSPGSHDQACVSSFSGIEPFQLLWWVPATAPLYSGSSGNL